MRYIYPCAAARGFAPALRRCEMILLAAFLLTRGRGARRMRPSREKSEGKENWKMENKFKRFLSLTLAFLMIISNVPAQAFATEGEVSDHGHEYSVVTVDATCTEEGRTTYTCAGCGDNYTEAIPAGHKYAEGVCSVCTAVDPDYVAPSDPEPYEESVVAVSDEGEQTTTETITVSFDNTVSQWKTVTVTYRVYGYSYLDVCMDVSTADDVYTARVPANVVEVCFLNYIIGSSEEEIPEGKYLSLRVENPVDGTTYSYTATSEGGEEETPEVSGVAMIGETEYATLVDAITNATAGDTITLLADVTEDVTVNKAVTIDGAGKTFTGMMTLKADTTIKNVNFDGKNAVDYAVETRGANYVTIEDCTAKNYSYGFLQLASGTALTTVKNVTVSACNYGVKIDYSNAVVLENVKLDCAVAGVLNSNYGEKTVTIKDSDISILGTWDRETSLKTTYVFEGVNSVDQFVIDAAIDTFKLAQGATLTAPEGVAVITDAADHEVAYENGAYIVKGKTAEPEVTGVAKIGEQGFETLKAALEAAEDGDTIVLLEDLTLSEAHVITKAITLDGNGKVLTASGNRSINVNTNGAVTIKNLTLNCGTTHGATEDYRGIQIIQKPAELTLDNVTMNGFAHAVNVANTVKNGTAKVNVLNSELNGTYDTIQVYAPTELKIQNSEVTGWSAVSVRANGTTVNVEGSELTGNNQQTGTQNGYAAINLEVAKVTLNVDAASTLTVTRVSDTTFMHAVLVNESVTNFEGLSIAIADGATINKIAETDPAVYYVNGVARIGYVPYTSLADAIANAKSGDTITLLTNIDEDVTVVQAPDVAITIDGNGMTMTGSITVNGKSAAYATAGLTIENINFTLGTEEVAIHLGVSGNNNTRYTSNVTVKNCSFIGEDNTAVGIKNYTGGCKNLTVTGCTATGVHSLIQVKGVDGLEISRATVTGKNGISVGTSTNVIIDKANITATGYGIRADGSGAYTMTVKGGTISAELPVVVRKTTGAYELTVEGAELTGSNTEGYQVIFTKGDDGTYEKPTGAFVANVAEDIKMFPVRVYVAQVGETKYTSLQDAINACEGGETVVLLTDITYGAEDVVYAHGGATGFGDYDQYNPAIIYVGGTKGATLAENQPSNVNVVIDLNGHTVTSNAEAYLFMIMDNAKLTITGTGTVTTNTDYPVLWTVGTETLVTVAGGEYVANNSGSLMWATHGGDLVITGGTFSTTASDVSALIVRNDHDRQNSKYFISGKATVTVKGGSFVGFNPEQMLDDNTNTRFNAIADGYIADEADGVYTVRPANFVAMTNGKKFESLQDAINACVAGDNTVTLLVDSAENVTIKQAKSVNITIDGAGKTYSGSITVDGNKRSSGTETLTIRNVKFQAVKASQIFIEAKSNTYVHYIIVDGCTFTGDDAKTAYGLKIPNSYNITVKNSTATKMLELVYSNKIVTGLNAENVTVTDSVNGFYLSYAKNVSIKGATLNVTNMGVYVNNNNSSTATIEGCTITAPKPVAIDVNSDTKVYTLVFNAGNTFTSESGNWLTISGAKANVVVDLTNSDLDITKVTYDKSYYTVDTDGKVHTFRKGNFVAQIGTAGYETLAAAIANAKSGDTITFLVDITEDVTVNKAVTIDGAGKTYTGVMTLTNRSDITIKNVNFDGKSNSNYAVESKGAYYITIEDCTAKNYNYGFVQVSSGAVNTTVKNVTVSDCNYGVKIDYSNAVVLENVKLDCAVAGLLNSNYGEKTITIRNSDLSILGTWDRGTSLKTTYVFEGENTVGEFLTVAALDSFKLADVNSTLTAPAGQTVTTDVENYMVVYENGVYQVVHQSGADIASGLQTVKGTGRVSVTTGLKNTYARESLVVELWDGETKLSTTTYQKAFPIAQKSELTVSIVLSGNSSSWKTEWHEALNVENLPDTIKVYVDGELADTYTKSGNVFYNTKELNEYIALDEVYKAAKIGNTYYASLQTAINAAVNGDVITLLADNAENVTIKQANGLSFTIDGAEKTFTGTITVDGSKRSTGAETLTIRNVNFNGGSINTVKSSYAHNITVDDCTFTGDGSTIAITLRHAYNITVKNVTATKLNELVYANNAVTGFTAENVTVTESNHGFWMQYGTNVTFRNVNVTATGSGITLSNQSAATNTVVENCTITAAAPLVIQEKNATKDYTLILKGTNTLNGENWLTISGQGATVTVDLSASDLDIEKVTYDDTYYGKTETSAGVWVFEELPSVARIGETEYKSLAAAIAAVQNGETIELLMDNAENVTIKQVKGLSFTIDGASKTYTGTITVDGNKRSTGAETLTIRNVSFNGGTINTVKSTYAHNITVEDCTFTGDGSTIAITLRHAYNITLKNVTATKLNELVYANNAVTGFTAENITVKESRHGFWMQYGTNVTFRNVNLDVTESGITLTNQSAAKNTTIENCTVNAKHPVYIEEKNATNNYTLFFKGTNTLNGENWLTVSGRGATVTVNLTDDASLTIDGVSFDETYYGAKKTGEKTWDITKVDAVAMLVNAGGEDVKVFASVNEAVAVAQTGETVKLLKNAEGDTTLLTKGITLDLNGYTYTVGYMVVFADNNVVDNSDTNAGRLAVSERSFMIQKDNVQLPIETETGYMFVEVKDFNKAVLDNGSKFAFQPLFEAVAHEQLLRGYEATGVKVMVRVSWTNSEGTAISQNFSYPDTTVNNVINSYKPDGKYGRMFTIQLKGLESYDHLSYEVVLVTDCGVEIASGRVPAKS